MARSRSLCVWTLALWAVCLAVATTGHQLEGPRGPVAAGRSAAAIGLLAPPAGDAVLPGRISDEVRNAVNSAPLRIVALVATLALLVELPALLRRRASAFGRAYQPLRLRRHAIALRAPPLQLA